MHTSVLNMTIQTNNTASEFSNRSTLLSLFHTLDRRKIVTQASIYFLISGGIWWLFNYVIAIGHPIPALDVVAVRNMMMKRSTTIRHSRKSRIATGFEKDIRIDSSSSWQQGMACVEIWGSRGSAMG
jgi:hypothetical protein